LLATILLLALPANAQRRRLEDNPPRSPGTLDESDIAWAKKAPYGPGDDFRFALGELRLELLEDVSYSGGDPAANEALVFDGAEWAPGPIAPAALSGDFGDFACAAGVCALEDSISGNVTFSGTVTGTTAVVGPNVTSGSDPGHTHSGGSVATDIIAEGNSNVEVIDAGTGQVDIDLDGARRFIFTEDGAATKIFQAEDAAGPRIENAAASSTNPTLIPDQSDPDTGLGRGTGVNLIDEGSTVASATNSLGFAIFGGRQLVIADADNSNVFGLVPPVDFTADRSCSLADSARMFPLSCIEEPTLGTNTAGVYVAQVADGTGIDGTANAEGATYTPTLDLTEINFATWGNGNFSGFSFDGVGTPDPAMSVATGALGFVIDDTTLDIGDPGGAGGQVSAVIDGVAAYTITSAGIIAAAAGGPAFLFEQSEYTNPTLVPDASAPTHGLGTYDDGGGLGGGLALIAGGATKIGCQSFGCILYDQSELRFMEDDTGGVGGTRQYIGIKAPALLAGNRTITLENEDDPIPFSAVADDSDDVAAGLLDETGTGVVVFSDSPTLTGTVSVGDGAGNDKLELIEEATNPTCSAGNYFLWANSVDGKIKKCQNGVTSDLDIFGFGGTSSTGVEYHPDNYPPASDLLLEDEFTTALSLTWTEQNLDSATTSVTTGVWLSDFVINNGGTTDAWHGATTPAPPDNGADWFLVAKVNGSQANSSATLGCGISIITGGTAAVPTEINSMYYRSTSGTAGGFEHLDHDDYDFAGTTSMSIEAVNNSAEGAGQNKTRNYYLMLKWVDASEDISASWSWDGWQWSTLPVTDTTVDGYPVALGIFSRDNNQCAFQWVRVLDTDVDPFGYSQLKVGGP
jgi:hypothetical protein